MPILKNREKINSIIELFSDLNFYYRPSFFTNRAFFSTVSPDYWIGNSEMSRMKAISNPHSKAPFIYNTVQQLPFSFCCGCPITFTITFTDICLGLKLTFFAWNMRVCRGCEKLAQSLWMPMTGAGVSRLSLDLAFLNNCWVKTGRKDTPTPVIGIRRPRATLREALGMSIFPALYSIMLLSLFYSK